MAQDFANLSFEDLKDQKETRLNKLLDFLAGQVSYVQGGNGPVKMYASLSAPGMKRTDNPAVASLTDQDVITLGLLKQLGFSGTPSGPGGGGGGVVPTPPTSSSSIIEAADFGMDSAGINAAIQSAPDAGATIHLRAGTWRMNDTVFMNRANIRLVGDGPGTSLETQPGASFDYGLIYVTQPNCSLQTMQIDGKKTTSTRIDYGILYGSSGGDNSMHGDPNYPDLIRNSPVWTAQLAHNFSMFRVVVQNGEGYATYIDARGGAIGLVSILECVYKNNIATVFGDSTYGNTGSWLGGIFVAGGGASGTVNVSGTNCTWVSGNYLSSWQVGQNVKINGVQVIVLSIGAWGLTATVDVSPGSGTSLAWSQEPGYLQDLTVQGCVFDHVSGNGLWSHTYSFSAMHVNFIWAENSFKDIGRDGCNAGGVSNCVVSNNAFIRIGYVADAPAYYPNQYAVAIDTSGYTFGYKIIGNVLRSVNGGMIDLDGATDFAVTGNVLEIADPGSDVYVADGVANYGFSSSGNITKGIQTNSTYDPRGGKKGVITNNLIRGLGNGAITLMNAEDVLVSGNNINHPGSAIDAPIVLACTGTSSAVTSPPRYCRNNVIVDNRIYYDVGGNQYCIYETDSYGDNVGPNFIRGNVISGANKGEYLGSTNGLAAGSHTAITVYTNSGTSATAYADLYRAVIQREGTAATSATKWYSQQLSTGTATLLMSLIDSTGLLNVSRNGSGGVIATGARTTSAVTDCVATGKLYGDSSLILADTTLTYPNDPQLDLLNDAWGVIRYNSTSKRFEQSISVSSGHRVWTVFGSGGGTAAGADKQIQYNSGGAMGADGNFIWDYATKSFAITGTSGQAAITCNPGYISTAQGLVSLADSWQAVQGASSGGGAYFSGYALVQFSSRGGYIDMAPITYAGFPTPLTGLGSFGANDALMWCCSTNSTGSPNTTYGVCTNGFVDAAGGIKTSHTNSNAIQAPNGGVTAKYLVATDSFFVIGQGSVPPPPSAGQFKLYADSTGKPFYWDFVSSSWKGIATGVGVPGGTDQYVQYNIGGVFSGEVNFRWNPTAHQLLLGGSNSVLDSAGNISIIGVYASSGGGVNVTGTTASNSIQTSGGVAATTQIACSNGSDTTSSTSALVMTGVALRFRINSGDQGDSGAIVYKGFGRTDSLCIVGSGTTSVNRKVFIFDWVEIGGVSGAAGLSIDNGYCQSQAGFTTLSTASDAIQSRKGGVTTSVLVVQTFGNTAYGRAFHSGDGGGNFHLDSLGSGSIFLGWYGGSGVVIGNGAGAYLATFNLDGHMYVYEHIAMQSGTQVQLSSSGIRFSDGTTMVTAGGAGVTSINSMVGPAININTSASGITISSAGNTVTINNTGVTSIAPGTGISVSSSTGGVVVSTNPSASVQFNQVTATGAFSFVANVLGATIAFQAGGGNFQVDGNGNISCAGLITTNTGLRVLFGGTYYTGETFTYVWPGGFLVNGLMFHNMVVISGLVVQHNV